MTTTALVAVLTLCPHLHAVEAVDVSEAIVAACSGPVAEPSGEPCVLTLAAVLHVESRCELYPPRRGTGAGPAQICQPRGCYGSTYLGRPVCLPPHELTGPRGVYWGAVVLRWKHRRRRSLLSALEAYNGSSGRAAYAAAVLRARGRVE